MKDLRLSKDDNGIYDIRPEDGNFVWAKDGTQVANHGHIRLNTFRGTLSLNGRLSNKENVGFDIYGIVLDMSKTQSEKELEIKRVIMGTPGYVSLAYFKWEQTAHSLYIEAKVNTEYGALTLTSATTPL